MPSNAKHIAILSAVRRIAPGHVMTYGQVAAAAGLPRHARLVGKVLSGLPDDTDLPWHRVVNARGEVSVRPGGAAARQRFLLENEGVVFGEDGRIDLQLFAVRPNCQKQAHRSRVSP